MNRYTLISIVTAIIIASFPVFGKSQSKFKYGFSLGMNATIVVTNEPEPDYYLPKGSEAMVKFSPKAGFRISYSVTNRLNFIGDLVFGAAGYRYYDYTKPFYEINETPEIELFTVKYDYITLPLTASYTFGKRVKFYPLAGAGLGFTLSASYRIRS